MSIDYERMNRIYPKQKAALTRAVNSGNPYKVLAAVQKAVSEWNEIGAWPDGWARWDVALSDAAFAQRMAAGPFDHDRIPSSIDEL
jgi:hypothetical protein